MAKVWQCLDWSEATQECVSAVWVDQSDWTTYLPTIEQAGMVGGAYFVGLMTLAVVRGLLFPKDEED